MSRARSALSSASEKSLGRFFEALLRFYQLEAHQGLWRVGVPSLVFQLDVLDGDGVAARAKVRQGIVFRNPGAVNVVGLNGSGLLSF